VRSTTEPPVVMVNRVLYRSSAIVRRQGDLQDRARARGPVVPGRLPRHRDPAAGPARRRVRRLHLGRPQVALRRPGARVPVRPPGPDPDARADGDGWFGTEDPFSFDTEHLAYHPTARRFEHGTPPAPVFFIAQGGLDVILRGHPRTHPRPPGRALGPPDRARRRARAWRSGPTRSSRAGGVVNVGVGPRPRRSATRCSTRRVHRLPGRRLRISPHFFNTEDGHRPLLRGARAAGLTATRGRTSTGTRCTMLFANPCRFHGCSSGCVLPARPSPRRRARTRRVRPPPSRTSRRPRDTATRARRGSRRPGRAAVRAHLDALDRAPPDQARPAARPCRRPRTASAS
jgi:hypothetical protein